MSADRRHSCSLSLNPGNSLVCPPLQSDEYSFYWGGHDHRDATPSTGKIRSSNSGAAPVTAAPVTAAAPTAQLVMLNSAESVWELLEIAREQEQHMQLAHWLRLLFRLFVVLHEDDQLQQYTEQLHTIHRALPQFVEQTAALIKQLHTFNSSSSSIDGNKLQQQQQQLVGQIADMLFAMATYALDCQQAAAATGASPLSSSGSSSSSCNSSAWYVSDSCSSMVDAVAGLSSSWEYTSMLRQDAVSLLWSSGQLTSLQQLRSSSSSMNSTWQAFFNALCCNIATGIRYANNTLEVPAGAISLNPYLLNDWAPEDLVDAVAGLSAAQHKSPAAAQLLDAAAHEVYRQLSNRHSTAGSFTVEGVVNLLCSYANLQYKDGPSLRMFDAVAGWLVKRIRARHVQAPSSPQQCAAVAAAFAQLHHRSVVVPELLSALNLQACKAAASAVELSQTLDRDASCCLWTLQHTAAFLRCHVQLGYRPPELMLLSLMPALMLDLEQQQQQQQQQNDALTVLQVLATLGYHPGRQVLAALTAAAWSCRPHETLNPTQLVTLLFSSAQLAAVPSAEALNAVVDTILLATTVGSSSSSGSSSRGSSSSNRTVGTVQWQSKQPVLLSASDVVRVLWSLVVLDALNIQRLGWLLVAVANGSWNKLDYEQLIVVKQAQVVLGEEGDEMAAEVLPPQLLTQMEKAWETWCSQNTVQLQLCSSSCRTRDQDGGHRSSSSVSDNNNSSSSSSVMAMKPSACDAAVWDAHQAVGCWLQQHAAATADAFLSVQPVGLASGDDAQPMGVDRQQQQQQRGRQVIGAWLLQQQRQQGSASNSSPFTWPSQWPQSLQQPLTLTRVQQQQAQHHQSAVLLLACKPSWYSSNEPQQPLGAAFARLNMLKAVLQQQQWPALEGPHAELHAGDAQHPERLCMPAAVHVPLKWQQPHSFTPGAAADLHAAST